MRRVASRAGFAWLVLTAVPLAAQIDDPRERLKDISRRIAEEMQEIDKLLLQRDAAGAGERIERAAKQMQELLDQAQQSQDRVVQGIDELIRQIEQMQQPGSGSGDGERSERPSQQPQDGQRPRPGQREQTQTPDHVNQQRQQGQQPQQQGQQPTGPEESKQPGQNQPGGQPPEAGTEQVPRAGDTETWGNLPPYLHFLQGRGGTPEVSERYRKQVEAFLKQAAKRREQ